jgi:hypothetical protein
VQAEDSIDPTVPRSKLEMQLEALEFQMGAIWLLVSNVPTGDHQVDMLDATIHLCTLNIH